MSNKSAMTIEERALKRRQRILGRSDARMRQLIGDKTFDETNPGSSADDVNAETEPVVIPAKPVMSVKPLDTHELNLPKVSPKDLPKILHKKSQEAIIKKAPVKKNSSGFSSTAFVLLFLSGIFASFLPYILTQISVKLQSNLLNIEVMFFAVEALVCFHLKIKENYEFFHKSSMFDFLISYLKFNPKLGVFIVYLCRFMNGLLIVLGHFSIFFVTFTLFHKMFF